jgi:MerR family transcriptional regulator, copper efflux regulator
MSGPATSARKPRPELAQARADGWHNIGQAAALSQVSAKMIRHYERIGLIPPASRTDAGYRLYDAADLHRLRFIRRARRLGFSIAQIGELLALWNDPGRASADVKRLARSHIEMLSRKLREIEAMKRALQTLARDCHGDARPDCPILDDLATDDLATDDAATDDAARKRSRG